MTDPRLAADVDACCRLTGEFTLRSVEMARDFEAQRRIDMASVREAVGQFQGVTGNEIRQQREAIDRINSLIRVSQQGR